MCVYVLLLLISTYYLAIYVDTYLAAYLNTCTAASHIAKL